MFITFGGIKWDYACVLIVTGFFVTLAGQVSNANHVQILDAQTGASGHIFCPLSPAALSVRVRSPL